MIRSTITRRLVVAAGVAAVSVAALSGCTFPGTDDAASTPTAAASPSASPSAAPASSVPLPTACRDLVSPEVYTATFADVPLNDPALSARGESGVVEPSTPAEGASAEDAITSAVRLECVWGSPTGDITRLTAHVSVIDPAVGATRLADLAASGYTCTDLHGGKRCQKLSTESASGAQVGSTAFLRDDVFLLIDQTDFLTNDLLGSIVAKIWG